MKYLWVIRKNQGILFVPEGKYYNAILKPTTLKNLDLVIL